MCNEAYRNRELAKIANDWSQTGIPLRFPEGRPNFAPLPGCKITDRVEIVRPAADAPGEAEMVTRRWSWPGPNGKPVYNFRSEGRTFGNGPSSGSALMKRTAAGVSRSRSARHV